VLWAQFSSSMGDVSTDLMSSLNICWISSLRRSRAFTARPSSSDRRHWLAALTRSAASCRSRRKPRCHTLDGELVGGLVDGFAGEGLLLLQLLHALALEQRFGSDFKCISAHYAILTGPMQNVSFTASYP
jgi:hypothetical protein